MEKCHLCDWEKSDHSIEFVDYLKENKIKDIDICVHHLWELNCDNVENQEECHVCDWENAETNETFSIWMKYNKTNEISLCDYHMLETANENQ